MCTDWARHLCVHEMHEGVVRAPHKDFFDLTKGGIGTGHFAKHGKLVIWCELSLYWQLVRVTTHCKCWCWKYAGNVPIGGWHLVLENQTLSCNIHPNAPRHARIRIIFIYRTIEHTHTRPTNTTRAPPGQGPKGQPQHPPTTKPNRHPPNRHAHDAMFTLNLVYAS